MHMRWLMSSFAVVVVGEPADDVGNHNDVQGRLLGRRPEASYEAQAQKQMTASTPLLTKVGPALPNGRSIPGNMAVAPPGKFYQPCTVPPARARWNPTMGIVQYGAPRSASTLQYELLCYIVTMKTGSRVCRFVKNRLDIAMGGGVVVKTHKDPYLFDEFLDQKAKHTSISMKNTMLFFSATGRGDSHPCSVYTQPFERAVYCPKSEVSHYREIFNLTNSEVSRVEEHIELWDIWRQCCGPQQSLISRLQLFNCTEPAVQAGLHLDGPSNPQCDKYNMQDVEAKLVADPSAGVKTTKDVTNAVGTCKRDKDVIAKMKSGEALLGAETKYIGWFKACENLIADQAAHVKSHQTLAAPSSEGCVSAYTRAVTASVGCPVAKKDEKKKDPAPPPGGETSRETMRSLVPPVEPSGSSCVGWDLSNDLSVPFELAFKAPRQPGLVAHYGYPADIWSFFDRLEAANAAAGREGFHAGLRLPGTGHDAVAQILTRKKIEGGIAPPPSLASSGLFVLLRGDSHMRIVFNMFVMRMTHDVATIKKSGYQRKTFHNPHLFCCTPGLRERLQPPFENCTMEIIHTDILETAVPGLLQARLGRGSVCIYWVPVMLWHEDVGVLQRWQLKGLAPDVLAVNGGAHYREAGFGSSEGNGVQPHEDMRRFSEYFDAWLASAASALERPAVPLGSGAGDQQATATAEAGIATAPITHLVILSSPPSRWSSWGQQVEAYEHVRSSVATGTLLSRAARDLTSYLDVHSLADVDVCGFSERFPAQGYNLVDPANASAKDRCGHGYTPGDPHLMGGFYIMVGELLLSLLRGGVRRCDPPPHVPSAHRILDAAFVFKPVNGKLPCCQILVK